MHDQCDIGRCNEYCSPPRHLLSALTYLHCYVFFPFLQHDLFYDQRRFHEVTGVSTMRCYYLLFDGFFPFLCTIES
jgi:hypothetical protein